MKNLQVGDDLLPIKKLITMKQILMYADASGDYNPIHIDEEFAKNSQFGRNIGHGMMVAATISELMVKNFAEAWYKTGKMKMRFKLDLLCPYLKSQKEAFIMQSAFWFLCLFCV